MRRHALLLVLGLTLAACAADVDPTTPTPTPAPSTPADTPSDTESPTAGAPTSDAPTSDEPASPVPGTSAPFPADTRPDSDEGTGMPVTLTDVRVGRHDGYERVVLDLAGGGTAGWDARYVAEPRHQGSGEPVEVDGNAVLLVDLTNIGLPDDTGVAMYDGSARLAVGDTIVEVVVGSTFEGHTQVFLGVAGEQPFRVQWIDGSVVVDVVAV